MEPCLCPEQLFTPALLISLCTSCWQDEGAAAITVMVPSQICKSKQGEGVIECHTAASLLCLTSTSQNPWLIHTLCARLELLLSHNSSICTKLQYLSLWYLIDLPPCMELSQLLSVSHPREIICNIPSWSQF